ncbi:hypothetical protein MIR68_010134 [Amoeboaphelidium protococcarum]|nr:hypothetical protein MIR68_010134 [Amoeboaphelidium protococcarum]
MSSLISNPYAALDEGNLEVMKKEQQSVQQQKKQAKAENAAKIKAQATTRSQQASNTNGDGSNKQKKDNFYKTSSNAPVAAADDGEIPLDKAEHHDRRGGQAHHAKHGQKGGQPVKGREFDRHSGKPRDSDRKMEAGWGEKLPIREDVQ